GTLSRRVYGLGGAIESQRRDAFEFEIPLVMLDLLLLAVHGVNVVAEEQVQVFVAAAGQFLFDWLELEKQVEPERADQRQPRILGMAELLDERAQNGKRGRLLAALLFGEQLRQRLQASPQRGPLPAKGIPM